MSQNDTLPKQKLDISRTEQRLPVILKVLRNARKGRSTPILVDDVVIDRRLAEHILSKYESRVRNNYFPRGITRRRLRHAIRISLPIRDHYDRLVQIRPDRRSSVVPAGELTLLTRVDIRKLPYYRNLEPIRKRLVSFLQEALTRFSNEFEKAVRRLAVKILLNRRSREIYDIPFRKITDESKKEYIKRLARHTIEINSPRRKEAREKARLILLKRYPKRIIALRHLLKRANDPTVDLRDLYREIKKILNSRWKIPDRVREGLVSILQDIRQARADPYLFLFNNIEQTAKARLGFFAYRGGPYYIILRPWPAKPENDVIRDLHRLLLALGIKAVKIYIRTKWHYHEERLKRRRSSPYAEWPVFIDTNGEHLLTPRRGDEAIIRIEVNVSQELLLNKNTRYLLTLVLLLLANLLLGFGPRTISILNDLLEIIGTHIETIVYWLRKVDNNVVIRVRAHYLSKYWISEGEG